MANTPGESPLLDLQTAIDNMAEAVLVMDASYTILYQNAAALALTDVPTGKGREDLERVIERRTPDGRPLMIEEGPIMRALKGERVRDQEVHLFNRERDAWSILLYSAEPIRDESGVVVRAVVNIRDVSEQRRMERQSAEHEAQLRILFENMAEPLFVVDAATLRATTNAAFRDLFLTADRRVEKVSDLGGVFQILEPNGEVLPEERWPISRALKGERFSNLELEVRRFDGRTWFVAVNGNATRHQDGSIAMAVITCRDITERKRAERELLRIRYNLETAQNVAKVGSWDSGIPDGRLWWSEETYRIFGVPAGTRMSSQDFFGFVHPEDVQRVREASDRAIASLGDYVIEHRIVRTDGQIRHVQQRAKIVTGSNGAAVGMIGSIQDITERKQADVELSTQREQLEAIFQAIQDAVTVFDMKGELVRYNKAAEAITEARVPPGARLFFDFFVSAFEFRLPEGGLLPIEQWPMVRVLRGESFYDLQLLCRHKESGREWFFSINGAPVFNQSGEQVLGVVITRDISEMKRAAQALADSETRYRTMVQTCPIGLAIGGITKETKGTLSLVNDAYLRMTGYTREEYESGSFRWDSITPPEWAASDEAGILDALKHGAASPYEKEYVRRDGTRVPVLAALALMPGGHEVAAFTVDLTERVESEGALRESEERLRMTMEAANVGTFDYRPNSGHVYLDDRSRTFWNLASNEDPDYESLMSRIHPDDRQRVRETIEAAIRADSDGSFDSEYRVVSSEGSVRWLISKGRVHFEGSGADRRVMRLLGINLDATENKRREEALRDLTARFETLANNISQLAWMTDRTGWIQWYNQRWYEYTGTTPEQVQGWGWRIVQHPDHIQGVVERFQQSIESGQPWEDTFPLRSRTGEYRWFLSRALPIRNEDGAIIAWFGTNTDITELRETTAELERINRIVKLAHEAGRSGAWDWNLVTGELTWTEEYSRLLGLQPDFKPTLRRFFSLIHPDDREAVRKSIQESIRQASTDFRTEYRTIHSNSLRWIEQRGQVFCDASGQPVRLVGIGADITDRKQLEQALIQSNEDLARFAYASSHDLQEPLRIISSFSTLLERRNRGRLDKESEEFLTYIVDGAARMSGMVSDLLQYSHVSTQPTAVAQVNLNDVLGNALANLRHTIEESGAVVSADELPSVQGNESLLERVFRNLIGNALKYRSPERVPSIQIGARNRGGHWEFSVADNGIGFKPEYAEQVFVMFKRLHSAKVYTGSGIGLAIVKRIVERHGGYVRAESEPGKGSTFYFSLPVHYGGETGNQPLGSS